MLLTRGKRPPQAQGPDPGAGKMKGPVTKNLREQLAEGMGLRI